MKLIPHYIQRMLSILKLGLKAFSKQGVALNNTFLRNLHFHSNFIQTLQAQLDLIASLLHSVFRLTHHCFF